MPKCNPVPPVFAKPSKNLEKLGEYAVRPDKADFRKRALSLKNFYAVVTEELNSDAAGGAYDCLTEADRLFCETWIYLARLEYWDDKEKKVKDGPLVDAIKRHLANQSGPDVHEDDDEFHDLSA